MATQLRDRDAIISCEGLIFRVYGYSHPPTGYVCDVEYAPSNLYRSPHPKAPRHGRNGLYYKFFEDQGLKFIQRHYPEYHVYYRPLQRRLVGVQATAISTSRLPGYVLRELYNQTPSDELLQALHKILHELTTISTLKLNNFGVFGSLLHGFYHSHFSDIDLTITGKRSLQELQEALSAIYDTGNGILINEFTSPQTWNKDQWRFTNFSLSEYEWHQRRKLIYSLYTGAASHRRIKVEFEPVLRYPEIVNEYNEIQRLENLGWIEAEGRILDNDHGSFMPSIYTFELDTSSRPDVKEIHRIISYVEEYRMQVNKGEKIQVKGHVEKVTALRNQFYQITLTYAPRYYEQVLKKI
jgi:predicted nucleotidyltransferase